MNGASPVTFTYDPDSLLTGAGSLTMTRNASNGLLTGTMLGVATDSRMYSTFGELSTYTANVSGSPVLNVTYTRDKLGRITQQVETLGGVTTTFDYSYDIVGRLIQVQQNGSTTASYTYNSNGNWLSGPGLGSSPTYDDQDRLLQHGPNSYTYTANGELATKTVGSTVTTYTYDELGNLTRVVLSGGAQIDYLIDGQNRRIGKKIGGVLTQGYLYDGQLRLVAELNGAGSMVSRFVYGTKANVPDYLIKGGVTYRIISDHLGSPRLVVDVATGTVAQQVDYDEFGNVLTDTNPGFQPFGFAGGLYDPNTGLVRFGARDYDAETGRWTTKDPIGFVGGDANLYGYVLDDPINLIDPAGFQTFGCFRRLFANNLNITNQFFFTYPTQLSRTVIGALTSGAVARTTGLTTLGMAARALTQGTGVANLSIPGTLGSLALNSVVNGALVAMTLEGGVIMGSAASALGQALAGECPPEPRPQCTQ